jgi:hypothetical protein
MTAYAIFMKGHQQGHWDILAKLPFVATGALAAFSVVSVGEHIKIMVADPATYDVLV